MLKRIVVALDGSAAAEEAVPYAEHVAAHSHADIDLVMVHDAIGNLANGALEGSALAETVSSENDAEYTAGVLEPMAAELRARLGSAVTAVLLEGPVVPTLSAYAQTHRADLIMLTTHGRTGLRRALMGSVAHELFRAGPVPVLMVRSTVDGRDRLARAAGFQRLLVPLDGTNAAEGELRWVEALGDGEPRIIVLARVVVPATASDMTPGGLPLATSDAEATQILVDDAQAYLDRVAADVRVRSRLDVRTVVELNQSVSRGLVDIAQRLNIDLIVVTSRIHGLGRALLGGVAERFLESTRSAVLIRHDGRDLPVPTVESVAGGMGAHR